MSVELKVVENDGTVLATLTDMVSLSPLVDSLSRAGSLRFGLHNLDPLAVQVKAIEREVQVWLDGSLVADGGWLVPITPESILDGSTDVVQFECRGLLWFFDRRYPGDADRRNYIDDGGMETAALPDWTAVGTTATRDNTKRINGTYAAKLVQATAGTDTYLSQSVSITAGGVGALMTAAAWFFVDPTGWIGEASGKRGLFLQRSVAGVVKEFDFAELNTGEEAGVPLGSWQRREITVHIPPNSTEDVEVRLYSPGGTIWWDEVTLTAMDSLSFYDTDQAAIADGLVVHAQDPAYGKSDLNIDRDTPATGVKRDRHYQHAEHTPTIGGALAEFVGMDNGFDQSVVVDAANRTYTVHYPRKGTARAALSWDELVRVNWVPVEGEQAANSMVMLGDGDGPDREEGAAIDAAAFGGVTVEEVLSATPGTPIDGLDSKAAEELRLRTNAARLKVTLGPGLRVGAMATGDNFDGPPSAHGFVDLNREWRAIEVALDLVTRCLTITAEAA